MSYFHSILRLGIILLLAPAAWAQTQVRAQPVERAPIIQELPLSGSIRSPRYSDLSAQESGLVQAIHVDVGDRVEQGDILLEMDGELVRLELDRLEARRQEALLKRDDAARLAAEAERLLNERNFSRSQYDTLLANRATEEVRLQQLEAEIRMARVKLQRYTLSAPFAGVIGFKHAEVGEWLSSGGQALQLVQTDPLRVQASIPERYYGEVVSGTPVSITVDAHPGMVMQAEVDTVVATAEFNTRSFVVWMDIPNSEGKFAPGMSANMVFLLGGGSDPSIMRVAADAVVRSNDGSAWVWVARDGKAQRFPVRLGRRNSGFIEVASEDLREGDQAITLGNESLRQGEAINVLQVP